MWHPRPILHDITVGDNNDHLTAQSQYVPDKNSTRTFDEGGILPSEPVCSLFTFGLAVVTCNIYVDSSYNTNPGADQQ